MIDNLLCTVGCILSSTTFMILALKIKCQVHACMVKLIVMNDDNLNLWG